jgi:hypothetical protein
MSGGTLLIGAVLVLLGFVLISRAREGRHLMGPPPASQPPPPSANPPTLPAAVQSDLPPDSQSAIVAALRGGNKIEAIKLYRLATGADLKASKDAVEAMTTKS